MRIVEAVDRGKTTRNQIHHIDGDQLMSIQPVLSVVGAELWSTDGRRCGIVCALDADGLTGLLARTHLKCCMTSSGGELTTSVESTRNSTNASRVMLDGDAPCTQTWYL